MNWKDEEIEMLITLYEERSCFWDMGHQEYMNRDSREVAYWQIDLRICKYDISREHDYKSKWKSVYIIARMRSSFVFATMFPRFATGAASKTFSLFPASLTTLKIYPEILNFFP